MAKPKNLNGIPHNLIRSFFGTERYYHKGYMGDWLLNAARKLDIHEGSLNVISAEFTPERLNIHPLVIHAKSLKSIIEKELQANGFPDDFIVDARMDFVIPDSVKYRTTLYVSGVLTDKEGRMYKSKRLIESGSERDFDPFDPRNLHPKSDFQVSLQHIKPTFNWLMRIKWRLLRVNVKEWWRKLF